MKRTLKFYFLSQFHLHNTMLSAAAIMLYIRSSGLIHLKTRMFLPFNQTLFHSIVFCVILLIFEAFLKNCFYFNAAFLVILILLQRLIQLILAHYVSKKRSFQNLSLFKIICILCRCFCYWHIWIVNKPRIMHASHLYLTCYSVGWTLCSGWKCW